MKRSFALALVLSFAAGALLMAGVGGGLGIFDRGPSETDVSEARQRGREEARLEVDARMDGETEISNEEGFQRGREATEWLSLDRLPNPDGWFTGVLAGRKKLQELSEDSFREGYERGQVQGRDEALGFVRANNRPTPASAGSDDPNEAGSQ